MKDHPAIARLLATGSPDPVPRRALRCQDCGAVLQPGQSCYGVAGYIFCPGCMESRREEVLP